MAIKILEHCPACGACLKVCPVKALTVAGGKLSVTENCLECGLCMGQCPVNQLELPKNSVFKR
ncbi:4Fe-4S binding protein [Desulfitobacterium chlororespirans]|uniref:4Fe-4S dicluster domain-containing protein n=1 Tax=Desulfitobacterium chlororespirans DSM 11544 TaxID=1121395 RepID=A0A1M7TQZ2_9FIRM|nr:4Fe-4S binding protein [Desulfitobacterium chlororespirans]SHN73161.1 4Fe-4S dicluster domain-containing protein [Desulfitobacterium chlororespirans DSM 11544]